jgi:hypothetical protein
MSSWIAATPGFGTCQFVVTWPPAWLPTKKTRSASATTRLAHQRE